MISFKSCIISFGEIDSQEVRVALVFFTVHQTLKEDLDEFKRSVEDSTCSVIRDLTVKYR